MNLLRDWRRASDYTYLASLPKWGWSWELLRRNPDYAAARERWLQVTEGEAKATPVDEQEIGPAQFGLREFIDPTSGYEEKLVRFQPRVVGGAVKPDVVDKAGRPRERRIAARKIGQVVARLDVHGNIDLQLDVLRRWLIWWRQKLARKGYPPRRQPRRPRHFVYYIRVLDALAAGATASEIADVFSSEPGRSADDPFTEKTIRNFIKAATRLRNQAYLDPLDYAN